MTLTTANNYIRKEETKKIKMKPLATYYKLVDRDTEKVGAKWKGNHLWKNPNIGSTSCLI